MSKDKWQKIAGAARLLGLGERASIREIKKAFRRASKKYHPDTASEHGGQEQGVGMPEILAAYELLLAHCQNFPVPLVPGEEQELDGEEWWLDRFGQDPLWGKG